MQPTERQAAEEYNYGNALLNEQRYEEAITAYDEALALAPAFAPAYYNRALARAYSGDPEGTLEDFRMAALNGFEADFFHDTWMRYLREYAGYRQAVAVCEDRRIPPRQRYALEQALSVLLQKQSFLLREWPEAGIRFSPDSLPLRCALGDFLINRENTDLHLVEELLLKDDGEASSDLETRWRLHYLLGALFASVYLETTEIIAGSSGLFFDADYVEDHGFFLDKDSAKGQSLEALLVRHRPGLKAVPEEERFARIALPEFEKAAEYLCAARRLHLAPAKAASLHWDLTQDLWRAYVDTTVFLRNGRAYSRAVTYIRLYNALTGLRGWFGEAPAEVGEIAEKIQDYYQPAAEGNSTYALSGGQLLLDFFVFEKASDTIVYGLNTGGPPEVGATRISPDAVLDLLAVSRQWENGAGLQAVLSTFRGVGLSPETSRNVAASPLLQELDTLLIGPVKKAIEQTGKLVIVPFGYLYNLPFHLLPTIRKFIDQGALRELVSLPAASFLAKLRKHTPADRGRARYLFVGGGTSISYEKELETVRTLFPQVIALTGEQATREAVLEALRRADVVHFACHGGFDYARNCAYLQLPCERLYPGDLFEAGELSLDLVLLNACVTGVYQREARNGDAATGLPTAFLMAGARQVIGSLWPIDDAAAVAFARRFFTQWKQNPDKSTSAILLETQRAMSREKGLEEVYYWGGYGVFGA